MSVRKSRKKSPITFRLPEDLEADWQACIDAGFEQTEIVVEALRRELPALREEYRKRRLEKLGVPRATTALPGPRTQQGAQTVVKIHASNGASGQNK